MSSYASRMDKVRVTLISALGRVLVLTQGQSRSDELGVNVWNGVYSYVGAGMIVAAMISPRAKPTYRA